MNDRKTRNRFRWLSFSAHLSHLSQCSVLNGIYYVFAEKNFLSVIASKLVDLIDGNFINKRLLRAKPEKPFRLMKLLMNNSRSGPGFVY